MCVKCERRLCGFNSPASGIQIPIAQRCLSQVWQEKDKEDREACLCLGRGERMTADGETRKKATEGDKEERAKITLCHFGRYP